MDFVWKLYGNTYAVHVTVALVGIATLNLALPAPLLSMQLEKTHPQEKPLQCTINGKEEHYSAIIGLLNAY